jgi:NAD(P)-dependent dehydrogenase (short-subunit alcohol dehydrogenase family)
MMRRVALITGASRGIGAATALVLAERGFSIAYMPNGLPVQCVSERDFLFPDADEKCVPDVRAYIQSYDVPAFHALLRAGSPEDAVAAFALRGLFENWTKELAGGWDGLPPHLMEWMARQWFNGHAADDTPGAFDA